MLSFIQSVVLTVLIAFLLRFFVIQPFFVEGSSMEPNFHNGQYIIIDKLSYRFREPKRGEVIVLHPPVQIQDNYIKRIIGLPGETIKVSNGEVFVNNTQLNETYLGGENHQTAAPTAETLTLGINEYYVMGDNRRQSSDSREFGPINKDEIEGRTWVVAYPAKDAQVVKTPEYNPQPALLRFQTRVAELIQPLLINR